MSNLINVTDDKSQNVTVEYSRYDSSIKSATIEVDQELEKSLTISALKDVSFNIEGDSFVTIDLKIEAKDNANTVELVLTKEAVKNLLLITNKMYNHLTK